MAYNSDFLTKCNAWCNNIQAGGPGAGCPVTSSVPLPWKGALALAEFQRKQQGIEVDIWHSVVP